MPNITRKRTGELLRALFLILADQRDGLPAINALAALRSRKQPTEYERGFFPSGGERYDKIVRFATIDGVKAAWMQKSDRRWIVTDAGMKAVQDIPDDEEFYRRATQLYREWKAVRDAGATLGSDAGGGGADTESFEAEVSGVLPNANLASITFEQADEQAWAEIETFLGAMPPYEFQELVAALLEAMGYFRGWIAPAGRDGGVDIVAYTDPLGTRLPRIKVQVKRQTARVAVDGLRSFMAVLGADDVGIFVNTGGFTKDAEWEARGQQTRHVTLVDMERLVALWIEHYAKLDDRAKRRLPLQPIWFLAPQG